MKQSEYQNWLIWQLKWRIYEKKVLLVSYNYTSGNNSYSKDIIISGSTKMKEEDIIDKYFRGFPGFSKENYKKAKHYLYQGFLRSEIEIIFWRDITTSQKGKEYLNSKDK